MPTQELTVELNNEFRKLDTFALQMGLTQIQNNVFMFGNFCEVTFNGRQVVVKVIRESHLHCAVELVASILREQRGMITSMSSEFFLYFDISESANADRLNSLPSNVKHSDVMEFVKDQCESYLTRVLESLTYEDVVGSPKRIAEGVQQYLKKVTLNHRHVLNKVVLESLDVTPVTFKNLYPNTLHRIQVMFMLCVQGYRKVAPSKSKWYKLLGYRQYAPNADMVLMPEHVRLTFDFKIYLIKDNEPIPVTLVMIKDAPC